MPQSPSLQIVAEYPLEQLWLTLSVWESVKMARKHIQARAGREGQHLSEQLLDRKAVGLAYCLRNARDSLQGSGEGWNRRLLNSYYGLVSLVGAMLIANPGNSYDLSKFEAATKAGHGLHNIDWDGRPFPEAQTVYVTEDGLLVRYLSDLQPSVSNRDLKVNGPRVQRAEELPGDQQPRLLSLDDLFARIPDLHDLYYRVTGRVPRSVGVGYNGSINDHLSGQGEVSMDLLGIYERTKADLTPDPERQAWPLSADVWLDLEVTGAHTPEEARRAATAISPLFTAFETSPEGTLIGCLRPAEGQHWHELLPVYTSPFSGSRLIEPLFGKISDVIALHYCLSYGLSILVRYRPSLWREITEGDYNEYFALIKTYHAVFSRVIPELALEKIAGTRVHVTQPGSWSAPL